MAHDQTYANLQVLSGGREDNTIYSNFCNHLRHGEREGMHRGKQGCGGKLSCGGWPVVYGKPFVIFLILGIPFFVILVLLIVGLSNVSALNKEMNKLMNELKGIQNKMPEITQRWEEVARNCTGDKKVTNTKQTTERLTGRSTAKQDPTSQVKATTLGPSTFMTTSLEVKSNTPVTTEEVTSSGLKQNNSANCKKLEAAMKTIPQLITNELRQFDTRYTANWQCFGEKCYYFSSNLSDWHKANESCLSKGLQLAKIDNVKEQAFIEKRINNTKHWIGLQDKATLNNATNATTTQGFLDGKLACGYSPHNGTWINMTCTQNYNWICQMTLMEYFVSTLKDIKTNFCRDQLTD